ncbi:amidohydrolase, partial [Mycobacteriaceae bacterium Msp059]|nr:amidohydrolase [Mycobacteriaceae bacterium Msp059]
DMVMFGSSYSHWQLNEPEIPSAFSTEQREKLLWRNAAALYGLEDAVASGSTSAVAAR